MAKNFDNRPAHVKASMKAQAGIERAAYFAKPGATLAGYWGAVCTVTKNRKRDASRSACRGSW